MFRDTQEELKRIEKELLEAEEAEETEETEEILEAPEADPRDYEAVRNYRSGVRNFANNYKAYNADRTDEDPEEFGRRVDGEEKGLWGLLALALCLLAGIVCVLVWWLIRFRGVF